MKIHLFSSCYIEEIRRWAIRYHKRFLYVQIAPSCGKTRVNTIAVYNTVMSNRSLFHARFHARCRIYIFSIHAYIHTGNSHVTTDSCPFYNERGITIYKSRSKTRIQRSACSAILLWYSQISTRCYADTGRDVSVKPFAARRRDLWQHWPANKFDSRILEYPNAQIPYVSFRSLDISTFVSRTFWYNFSDL